MNLMKEMSCKKSPLLEKIRKTISLKTRIKIHLEMEDYDNWSNGKYLGDKSEETEQILNIVDNWLKDGAKLR